MEETNQVYYVQIRIEFTENLTSKQATEIINEADYKINHPKISCTEIVEILE